MSLIVGQSNIDYLITPLKLHYGDLEGTAYSDAVYRTALINSVRFLHNRWGGKYVIDGNNIARNPDVQFNELSPPIIENGGDEWALVLAATVILRQVQLTSSSDSFTNWSTPDLTVSSGSKERTLVKLYEQARNDLDTHFRKGLGRSRKRFLYSIDRTYPITTFPDNVPGTDGSSQ